MVGLAKWWRVLAVLCTAVLLWNAPVRADDDDEGGHGRVPTPPEIAAKGQQCVQPTPVMRRSHMKFILHHRDETMHQGVRTKQYSLKECINCHVQKDASGNYPSITSNQHFCNSCHSYAAVKIDCFECHASHPGQADATAGAADPAAMARMARAHAAGGIAP